MGKKKKNKVKDAEIKEMIQSLKDYLEIVDNYLIIQGLSQKEYEKSIKKVKQLIKKLEKGEYEDVFDESRCDRFIND